MSKGVKPSPSRCRRYASNISFHAAACTFAVWVMTPSRSNRQARMPSGSPSRPGTAAWEEFTWIRTPHRALPRERTPPNEGHNLRRAGHEEGMTTDAVNDPGREHPRQFDDAERDEIEALRRRFEADAPQAFTDSDAARFERITGTLGVPAFPATREELIDI